MKYQSFTIQDEVDVETSIGDYMPTWSDVGSVTGIIDLLTGTDVNTIQKAIVQQSTHVAVLMPVPSIGITDKMRLIYGNKWYSITYVDNPAEQDHHMELFLTIGGDIDAAG